uniref:Uncharacterized protein n=1 Tax=Sphaerodactylus townsendi TaxID=933632 RepID=A0ACB8EXQ6_9SAUR
MARNGDLLPLVLKGECEKVQRQLTRSQQLKEASDLQLSIPPSSVNSQKYRKCSFSEGTFVYNSDLAVDDVQLQGSKSVCTSDGAPSMGQVEKKRSLDLYPTFLSCKETQGGLQTPFPSSPHN